MTAKEMANAECKNRPRFRRWAYSIKSNPHPRKHPKHVQWHNDFYDECRKIGRPI